jgi:alpha-N-arabinofuranosidase
MKFPTRLALVLSAAGLAAQLASAAAAWPGFTVPVPTTSTSARGEAFANPIITGFSPDPSLCRVGDDFYLVTSTFEYFPGVPVYHSRDLVNWELISYCLTTPSQLPLGHCLSSSGIYAPVLRYHDGVFYMITTNFASKGAFYVTATDPRGPWSEPVWLGNMNADPSLLFDDDGKVYVVHPSGHGKNGGLIYLMELDVKRGAYVEGQQAPGRLIWTGTGGQYPEGPHLYKIAGQYYLMIAEGGTGSDHRETIARSDKPEGPYIPFENNPILTHRDLPDHPISSAGHADLVQLQDGSWWGVCLGVRPKDWRSPLGRESFLAPVEWSAEGWPIMGDNRRLSVVGPGPALPRHPFPAKPVRDDFAAPALDLEWNHIRNPDAARYSLTARPGWMRLTGSAVSLDDLSSPTALVRRQRHFDVRLATSLEFAPTRDGDEAGIVLRQTDALHAEFCVRREGGENFLVLKLTEPVDPKQPNRKTELYRAKAPAGAVQLEVVADRDNYHFGWKTADGRRGQVGSIPTATLAVEASWPKGIMCFTGMMLGVYATGNGAETSAPADFDWFDYEPLSPPAK